MHWFTSLRDKSLCYFRQLFIRVRRILINGPWNLAAFFCRLMYGFHVVGAENIPPEGPFILVLQERAPIAMLVSGWISIVLLNRVLSDGTCDTMSYLQEDLFAFGYFREALGPRARGHYAALIPHSAGRLALSLLDGYRVLRDGGIVIMNPEGDAPWDGRPLPIGHALAWLGLYSAAPIVPALCTVGAYDIWPRWQPGPNLRGRMGLKVGQPFRLCDVPQERVTEEDLVGATARIRAEFDQIVYGPGGLSEWAGPPLRDGRPVEQPIWLCRASDPVMMSPEVNSTSIPLWKRGLALLLWRCPVCGTSDALLHERPRFRPQTLRCQACGVRWQVQHVVGKDFRLRVVEGPADLVGLDMAVSTWYDEMKRGFQPTPISASGVDLLAGEEVYLEARDVPLLPYRPNALFEGWTEREAPQAQPRGRHQLADWASIGEGRLLLTSQRLLWQGPQGEVDFMWPSTTAISIFMLNVLGIRYGTAPYRLLLGQEMGLKWLTYAGTLAQQVPRQSGHKCTVSPF